MEGKVVSEEGVKFQSNIDGSTYFREISIVYMAYL
jgi:hypothetical protein